jgi:hypothetical protein
MPIAAPSQHSDATIHFRLSHSRALEADIAADMGLLLAAAWACLMARACDTIFKRVFRIQILKSLPSSFKLDPTSILPSEKTRLLALDFQVCNAACQHAQIRTREIEDGLIELPNNRKPSLITPFIKPRFPKHSGRLEAAVCSF